MNIDSSSLHGSTSEPAAFGRGLFFVGMCVARLIRRSVGMSGVLREPRFWCFGRLVSKAVPAHGARNRTLVRLRASFFTKETGGKENSSGGPCSSSYLHRAGREAVRFLPLGLFFLSAPPSSEPYSRLNRTTCGASQIVRFSTSRQSTPHCVRESGFFSCFGGAGLVRLVAIEENCRISKSDTHPHVATGLFRYKGRYSDFPDQ